MNDSCDLGKNTCAAVPLRVSLEFALRHIACKLSENGEEAYASVVDQAADVIMGLETAPSKETP